ncbi:M14 family zinc carboxypeptidase [Bacteriovorax sp. Seq25_V]|uniref:M14 family zinc carboxypeptidase n=1 Tax=Bacteriovorax sp. Seq25_V TaxID=1201288 RepID=UPI000389F512|nr:M14 family zinc carboxypeptidase [Bacteriovorax sp. Seq25_V]EQC45673.1 zinc carboxypeptidase [Bacteriovorax sp. Seq25_V]
MREFQELKDIEELTKFSHPIVRHEILDTIDFKNKSYPLHAFSIGSQDPEAPTFGIFAGVHGLERVGTHLAISNLQNLFTRLSWDDELASSFSNFRLVCIPLINPVGMDLIYRSNGNGVDLMRNSPVESTEKTAPLLGGQRYSSKLPWYRGQEGVIERENLAVINFVKKEMFPSKFSMALDLHSGFGMKDRLWFPYAKTRSPFPLTSEALQFKSLLDKTLPHHIYLIEQQSQSYTTSGDLWDYLFDLSHAQKESYGTFIPWTLELGSWLWVKKNPIQVLSVLGLFNPVRQHRFERVMRRHMLLFDFFTQAIKNHHNWVAK